MGWIAGVVLYAMGYEFARASLVQRWEDGRMVVQSRVTATWEDTLFIGFLLGFACLAGWVIVSLLTILLPHWRKAGYVALLVVLVTLAGLVAWTDLHWRFSTSPTYWPEVQLRLLLISGLALLAGVVATFLARPVVRLLVRILVPPRMRPPLAYLWLVDGKPPPMAKRHV